VESIDLSSVNFLAVVVAGIAHMAVGMIWFQSRLFGKAWSELTGKDLTPAMKWIPVAVVGHMAIALVLAILMVFASVTTILGGLAVAVLVWLGFVVTLEIGELVWEKIEFKLFLIRIGNHLVALAMAGMILGAWR
jgi:hypothetical protein